MIFLLTIITDKGEAINSDKFYKNENSERNALVFVKGVRYAILHFKGKMHTTAAAAAATSQRKIPQIERKVGAVFFCSKYYAASCLMYKYSTNFVFHIPLVPSVPTTAAFSRSFLEIK